VAIDATVTSFLHASLGRQCTWVLIVALETAVAVIVDPLTAAGQRMRIVA
jgi:hypothetical protein